VSSGIDEFTAVNSAVCPENIPGKTPMVRAWTLAPDYFIFTYNGAPEGTGWLLSDSRGEAVEAMIGRTDYRGESTMATREALH
jgi:hypothetical protein